MTIKERAEEYSRKYNDMTRNGVDPEEFDYEIEGPKYSCDGCDQNLKALFHAFEAGARSERKEVVERIRNMVVENITKRFPTDIALGGGYIHIDNVREILDSILEEKE